MVSKKDSNKARLQRHKRVRGKISGTEACPRLCVYRSLKNIYAQIIDDETGVTLVAASTVDKDFNEYGGNKDAAKAVGLKIAERRRPRILKMLFLTEAAIFITEEFVPLPKAQEKAD